MQDDREISPGVREPITRGTPESARALEEARVARQRDLNAARQANREGKSDLEVEIIRNRSDQTPNETRVEHTNDVLRDVRRVLPEVVVADGSSRTAIVTPAMANRAVDANFRTSFDDDRTETLAIAVATVAYRNGNAGWFDGIRSQETLDNNALNFSRERVAEYLQAQGVNATAEDIAKIAVEGQHIATGREARHGQSNGNTR